MDPNTATVQERTEYSRGFDRGNYGNAYESQDWSTWSKRNGYARQSEAYRDGMVLGFFSSYELGEIVSHSMRRQVKSLRAMYAA